MNADLTMQDLSEKMQLPTKVISQVINQESGKSFFDFINTYRCEEAKKLINSSDPRVTILEILYEAGFNSKSSFNKEFKKLTGSTPTEYRKSLGHP